MKESEEVVIDGNGYRYSEFYNRLESYLITPKGWYDWNPDENVPSVRCPKCHNHEFSVHVGNYEMTLKCKCGEHLKMGE